MKLCFKNRFRRDVEGQSKDQFARSIPHNRTTSRLSRYMMRRVLVALLAMYINACNAENQTMTVLGVCVISLIPALALLVCVINCLSGEEKPEKSNAAGGQV
ncbi:unnamed protein product [Cuscuta epithymum]|uniref:Uncharacterized protein n=1 Tax=Cuscuta epithymum TaxID=186058 RepID=A0AAV0FCV4_9ASTE|nr:unnamed protein product [Cuscuta epithymum]